MAAATDAWLDHCADWPGPPREPDGEDQPADPEPADADGYEPI